MAPTSQKVCPKCSVPSGEGPFCTGCGSPSSPPVVAPVAYSPQYSSVPPGYVLAPQFRYGNFLVRFLASFIDNMIALMLVVVVVVSVGLIGSLFGLMAEREAATGVIAGFFAMLLFAWPAAPIAVIVYFVKMETGAGQATLGKRMCGLKIVNLQGGRITVGQSLGRFFVKWLISDLLFFIGYLMAAFTEKRQALHDMAAGTLVVEAG